MFDLAALRATVAAQGVVARVVLASVTGSTPRDAGTSMLVWDTGCHGTIGGGQLEFEAIRSARDLLSKGQARRVDKVALGPHLRQCCGGGAVVVTERFDATDLAHLKGAFHARAITSQEPDLAPALSRKVAAGVPFLWQQGWLVERFDPSPQPVLIHGAGHVGRALAQVLGGLPDFHVTVADTRPEWREGLAQTLPDPIEAAASAPPDAHHLIMTHSHDLDLALCHALLKKPFSYVGLIGSQTKWARFKSRLEGLGHAHDSIERITCPIGDPSLGKHPHAIAIGVAHSLLQPPTATGQHGP